MRFFGMALALVLVPAGCGEDPVAPAPPPAAPGPAAERSASGTDARIARGRAIYLRYCALCHGQEAEGYAADHANAIGNPAFLAIASDEFLRDAIRDGRPGTVMSAWGRAHGGPLDDEMVEALVVYLRSLAREPPIDVSNVRIVGSVERARPVYAERCARCHGERGEGSEAATSISHPEFLEQASDGFLRHVVEHGRPGTPMPSHADLPSQTIDDLVALVRALEHVPERVREAAGAPPPGLGDLVVHPDGDPPRFTLREGRFVSAEQVRAALQEGRRMVILDARAPSDWAIGHIPGAAPFPFYDVEQMARHLPDDGTWIVAYCACPHGASGHVVDELRRRGFEHTAILDEGIHYWIDHRYPVETGSLP